MTQSALFLGCSSQTYGGHDYMFCPLGKTWATARAECRAAGMDLARIDNAAENDFIRAHVALFKQAWIGATDQASEGAWQWISDGTPFWSGSWNGAPVAGRYSNWAALQPGNQFSSQDCGKIAQIDGRWWDENCLGVFDYVCEDLPPPTPPAPADTACWDAPGLQSGAPWPMRGLCPLRRAGSKFIGSQVNTVNWTYTTGGAVRSSAAVAADGTLYVGSDDTYVYAISPGGSLRWRYKTGNKVRSSPALGADGALFVGSEDGYLYALDMATGALRWRYNTSGFVDSSPAIDAAGTVYVGSKSDYVYALNPANGSLVWSYKTNGDVDSSPALGPDGTIYVGSDDNYLYALKPAPGLTAAQRLKWKVNLAADVNATPAIGPSPDNAIYVRNLVGKLFKLAPSDGQMLASYTAPLDVDSDSSPAIGLDGTIYVPLQNKLYAFTPDLTVQWSFDTHLDVKSSPAIGADGTVYFGGDTEKIYALKPDGTVLWTLTSNGLLNFFRASPAIGKGGALYVGGDDKKLYSIGSFTCDANHKCENGTGPCTADSGCAQGLTCGHGIAYRFGLPDEYGVCWDPGDCAGAPPASCGDFRSACGTCCVSDCGAAGTPNGCGGICQACVPGADTDLDGISDCEEQNDGRPDTNPVEVGASCGNGVLDPGEVCDTGLTPYCSADCAGESSPTACLTDGDCGYRQTCGTSNGGQLGAAPNSNYCWPTEPCATSPAQSCGTSDAACGPVCQCQPSCAGKSCGDDSSDGCGGACPALCETKQAGCRANADCPDGNVCGIAEGPRYGFPEGTNVALLTREWA